jgi:hypothetical protein
MTKDIKRPNCEWAQSIKTPCVSNKKEPGGHHREGTGKGGIFKKEQGG